MARKTKPVRGADKIGLAAGAVLNRHKVAKLPMIGRAPGFVLRSHDGAVVALDQFRGNTSANTGDVQW